MSRVRDLYLTICEITTSKHDSRTTRPIDIARDDIAIRFRFSTKCIIVNYTIDSTKQTYRRLQIFQQDGHK